MNKKEIINKNVDDDEIKIFKNYVNLDVQNKILICLYAIIVLLIINTALPYVVSYFQNRDTTKISKNGEYDISSFNEITIADVETLASSKNIEVLFICTENDANCVDFLPIVQRAQKEYKYKTNYLNIETVALEEKEIFLKYDKDDFIKNAFGGVPMVITLKNNKIVEGWVGVSSYEDFEEFLKHSGVKKQ